MDQPEDVARRAVARANAQFYRAFATGDFVSMDALWAARHPVVCIHPGWPPVRGRKDVMASWSGILAEPPEPPVRAVDEEVFVMGESAMVVCYEAIGEVFLSATNLFVWEDGAWRMIHHHAGLTEHRPKNAPPAPGETVH